MKLSLFEVYQDIQEKQRYAQEKGKKFSPAYQRFKPIYDNAAHKGNLFIQYSNVNKLGINPQSEFDTPLGIYAYPAYKFKFDDLIRNKMPFASDRDFIIGFKIKEQSLYDVLFISSNGSISSKSAWSQSDIDEFYEALTEYLLERLPNVHETLIEQRVDKFKERYAHYGSGKAIVYTVHAICESLLQNGQISKETSKIYKALHITGIVDEGSSSIHTNEPTQAVFFSKESIEQIFSIPNPRSAHSKAGQLEEFTMNDKWALRCASVFLDHLSEDDIDLLKDPRIEVNDEISNLSDSDRKLYLRVSKSCVQYYDKLKKYLQTLNNFKSNIPEKKEFELLIRKLSF